MKIMFEDIPADLDDSDEVSSLKKKKNVLNSIRAAVAHRWLQIMKLDQDDQQQQTLVLQMEAFLHAVQVHFEPVSFFPRPELSSMSSPSKTSLSSGSPVSAPRLPSPGQESRFEWRFLDFDGESWALIKVRSSS